MLTKHRRGDPVAVGLAPDGLGLGLNAFLAVEDGDGAVEDAERTLDFDREVHVAGGIDQVELVLLAVEFPRAGGGGGLDGDAALLLFLQEVHGRGALVHLTDLVVLAGVVEDALGDGRLAGVDVGTDPEVANTAEVG